MGFDGIPWNPILWGTAITGRMTLAMKKVVHMRRSVISTGRPEITWIVGNLEVICEWLKIFHIA